MPPLNAADRNPGKYEAIFYPTAATTYTYRLFGAIQGAPFDVTFTCSSPGHVQPEDRTVVQLANGVARKGIVGGYGCTRTREEVEFPPRPPASATR